jgi:hypothetical protein
VRRATLLLLAVVGFGACNDVRDFAGEWRGDRTGASPVLHVGAGVAATLTIDTIDKHGLRGHIVVVGMGAQAVIDADFQSLEPAEADALATMTFSGAPLRVYLAFVPTAGGGSALAIIALYDSHRIELRLLEGGGSPMYAIYALTQGS